MKTLLVILLVICIAGMICLTISYINDSQRTKLLEIIVISSGLCCVVIGIIILATDYYKQKEFPAWNYTLKLKITEFEQQKDTTYVLIPKEKSYDRTR